MNKVTISRLMVSGTYVPNDEIHTVATASRTRRDGVLQTAPNNLEFTSALSLAPGLVLS